MRLDVCARDLPFECRAVASPTAAIAQLGERQTEDLKVPGSIPGLGSFVLPVGGVLCLRGCVQDGFFCCGGVCVWHDGVPMLWQSCLPGGISCVCLVGGCCRFVAVVAPLHVWSWVALGGPRDMVALSGLTLLVIVCQCGMLTLVLVCLGVRAECNWAKSSQQAASLRFCVCRWRARFAFVRCWGRCVCVPWACHLERVMLLCAPDEGLTDGVSWSGVRPAHHVDGLPLPNR